MSPFKVMSSSNEIIIDSSTTDTILLWVDTVELLLVQGRVVVVFEDMGTLVGEFHIAGLLLVDG